MMVFRLVSIWPVLVLFLASAQQSWNTRHQTSIERFCQFVRRQTPLAKDLNCSNLDEDDLRAIHEAIINFRNSSPGKLAKNEQLEQVLVNIITKQIDQPTPDQLFLESAHRHGQSRKQNETKQQDNEDNSAEDVAVDAPGVGKRGLKKIYKNRFRFGGSNSEEKRSNTTAPTVAAGKRHLRKTHRNRHRYGGGSSEEKTTTTVAPTVAAGKRHLRKTQRNRHRYGGGSSEEKKKAQTTTAAPTTLAAGKRHLRNNQRNRHRGGGQSSEELIRGGGFNKFFPFWLFTPPTPLPTLVAGKRQAPTNQTTATPSPKRKPPRGDNRRRKLPFNAESVGIRGQAAPFVPRNGTVNRMSEPAQETPSPNDKERVRPKTNPRFRP